MSTARERLMAVLQETGLAAKKSLGQNFLVSDAVIEKIIARAKTFNGAHVIEIGPGPGALTYFLRQFPSTLTLIELDRTMSAYWREKNLIVREEDALRADWGALIKPDTVLVSNLPYQISASLVIDRSLDELPLKGMVLMFQKEVAQRIRAQASTPEYGFLSVIAQTFWMTETVSEAGPRDFQPPPNVASRVLGFTPKTPPVGLDRQKFLEFVKTAFAQRRKLMKSNLSPWLNRRALTVDDLMVALERLRLPATARAEELTPAQFLELYGHFDHSGK